MRNMRTRWAAILAVSIPAAAQAAPPEVFPVPLACAGAPVIFETTRLNGARSEWLQATLDIIEESTEAIPNPRYSVDEWKCQVAEHQFGAEARRSYGNSTWSEAHAQRILWAEEVVFFYCLAEPFAEPFAEAYDYHQHAKLRDRHTAQRFTWRPHHLLPGETRKEARRVFSNGVGLALDWSHVKELTDLRTSLMPKFVARDEAVVMLVAQNAAEAKLGRPYLRQREFYGESIFPTHWRYSGLGGDSGNFGCDAAFFMRLLRGFRNEAFLYADAGLDAPLLFSRQNTRALMDAGTLAQVPLYDEDKVVNY